MKNSSNNLIKQYMLEYYNLKTANRKKVIYGPKIKGQIKLNKEILNNIFLFSVK